MKKFIVLFVILFTITLSNAQQILWDQCNGISGFNNLIEDVSGNIYTYTYSDSSEQYIGINRLSKFDKDIQLMWTKDSDSGEYFIKYIEDDQSFFSLVRINDSSVVIKKYNSNKNLLWITDTLSISRYYYSINEIKKTAQNNYLFAFGGLNRSVIICTDHNGNSKWRKDLDITEKYPVSLPFFGANYLLDLVENNDKGIMTVENFFFGGDWNPDRYITVKQLIDSNGVKRRADTSLSFPDHPSNFLMDNNFYNYPFFKENTSHYYPEFYSSLYYNKDELIFKVTNSDLDVISLDTIENYIDIEQENVTRKINDSSYFLFAKFIDSHRDTINYVENGRVEFRIYNITGNLVWNYNTPFYVNISSYNNAAIYQLSEKKFLVELNDPLDKKIYRFLFDDLQLKWQTVSADSIQGNHFNYHAIIDSYHIASISNNPSSHFNTGDDTSFYTLQSFWGIDDSEYAHVISYVYGINTVNGNVEKFMRIDSFALPKYYYTANNINFYDTYYAVNFFKVLPDDKLFLSTVAYNKCNSGNLNSYLAILGRLNTSVKNSSASTGKLNIYPNPSNGLFKVDFHDDNISTLHFQLIDITGKIIYTESKLHQYKTEFTINTASFSKGIYWIKLNDGNNIYSNAIIVQ
ncbi:MAG: type sorting protein [Bacteroidota bacterium]|nr:type sorting protein [Bacteroidota bacterium]